MSAEGPWRSEVSVQLKTSSLCAEWGSAWVKCGWVQLVSKEQTEPRGTLKSGPSSNICFTSLLEVRKGLCLERLSKAGVLSVFQIIFSPTVTRLIIQQWVIKESTGRKGLCRRSTLLPERHWAKLVILMQVLFEEAFIEQLWVTGPSFVLQAEEQVPEVDSGDALSHKLSGARSPGASRLGGAWPWALCTGTPDRRVHFPFFSRADRCQRR